MRTFIAALVAALLVCASAAGGQTPPGEVPPFDSPLDGVWVGAMQIRSADSDTSYPLLLNLDADATNVTGLALLPDDLEGKLASFAFFPLRGELREGRLVAEIALRPVPTGAATAREPLRLNLRIRKEALTGTVNASELRRGDVELHPVTPDKPLQHVWVEELPAIRSGGPLALAIFQDDAVTGLGSLGAESGPLLDAAFDGEHFAAVLRLPSGDRPLSFNLKSGRLSGSSPGDASDNIDLYPGGVRTLPAITQFAPEGIPVGRPTRVTATGRNLAPGFLVHFAAAGVSAALPTIVDARSATLLIEVAADVPRAERVEAVIVGADGLPRLLPVRLRLDPAAPISFAADLVPVFRSGCAISGCHITPSPDPDFGIISPPGNLILEPDAAYAYLVGRQSAERPDLLRVAPGDPDASYLIMKLRGSAGIVGQRMPFGGPYLSDATVEMFVAWIRDGAPRN